MNHQYSLFKPSALSELVPARELGPIVTTLENHLPKDAYNRSMNLYFSTWIIACDGRVVLQCNDTAVIQRLSEWIKDYEGCPKDGSTTQKQVEAIKAQLAEREESNV